MRGMSIRTVALDEQHFRIAEDKARAMGKTPEQYLQALIDADSRSFDELLAPIRSGFDQMSDADIDGLFDRAQKAARQKGE
jgi:hypothetical protein